MRHTKAFSLVEILVVLGILGVVMTGVLQSSIVIGTHFGEIRDVIKTRGELAVFSQSIYSFLNRSKKACFWDLTSNKIINYSSIFPLDGHTELDKLFLIKEDGVTEGLLEYDPKNFQITWQRNTTKPDKEVILKGVYRNDVKWADDGSGKTAFKGEGDDPIFWFPHDTQTLWQDTGLRPRFVVLKFKKMVSNKGFDGKTLTVPVHLIIEVGSVN